MNVSDKAVHSSPTGASSPRREPLYALLTFVGTWIGNELAHINFPATGAAIVFVPYAVLTAALMLAPRSRWWIYIVASTIGHLMPSWVGVAAFPTAFAASTQVANVVRALVAAIAWRRMRQGPPRFQTFEDTALFLGIAGLLAPVIGASLGAAIVVLYRSEADAYWQIWTGWFLANAIVGITLLPLLLVAADTVASWRRQVPVRRLRELVLLLLGLTIVATVEVIGHKNDLGWLSLHLYAPLPFLLWAAARFGPGVMSASLCIIATAAIVDVVSGGSTLGATPNDDGVQSLYLVLAFRAIPCLLLAAALRERERVFAALHEGQERYMLATSAGSVGVWDWTPSTDVMYVDSGLKAALGYRDDEILDTGTDWLRHVHPADLERVGGLVADCKQGKTTVFESEHRFVRKDGVVRWFLSRGAGVAEPDGRVLRLVGTATDITERKHAQDALRDGEQRMALAASSANLGFWEWNRTTNVLWLSAHAKRLLGLTPNEHPSIERVATLLHEEDTDRAVQVASKAVAKQGPYEGEFRIVRDDGDVRWLSVKGRLSSDHNSVASQVVGVVIDVTERKLAEVELQNRRRELAHLSRVATLGQLSGALAHELRQPLTAIRANAEAAQRLLARKPPNLGEVHTILTEIADDDERAGKVIGRMRGLLKNGDAAFEQLELSSIVQDGLELATPDLIARRVAVFRELEWSLPPVYGDRVELEQVVLNLIMNGCEAMDGKPASERRLTIGTTCDDAGDVVAYVVDRGTGINENDLRQIFEPFVTSKREGLGLGLAICRTIITAHRGRLWATNNPDGGATFSLALPSSNSVSTSSR